MGLLEEQETAARVRVEELRAEAEQIMAELGEAEMVPDRRLIARAEPAEALSAPAEADGMHASGPQDASCVPAVKAVPAAGSQVPRRHEGMSGEALASDYRRILEVVESGAGAGKEGLSAKELTHRLGLELVPSKIEGVRCKAKRLAERGWLAPSPSGRFMPRQSIEAAPATSRAAGHDGRGGGS
ncbi:hypothetical protein ACIQZB_43780 [Streptomyces sp. NPDC097727]|uniref:hypothetical protein n=1 Tax=Streptomyces sp. NPDC097727 TaxID=3366092 RepID=UPI00380DB1A0